MTGQFPAQAKRLIDTIVFGLTTCVFIVVAHAIAYMTHEYSHSIMAWTLGWMPRPLALDYGRPSVYNILFLGDVGDNVQYDPIFASGHGVLASIIALAGTIVGNGLLYFGLYSIAKSRAIGSNTMALAAIYWIGVMCAGNVWGYVPIRAITSHADIAIAAKGLGVSTWVLFPFLIGPALYVVYHFFCRLAPRCIPTISSGSPARKALVIALTAYWFFAFFGGDGTDGSYGLVTQVLAITSKYILFPFAVMWMTRRYITIALSSTLSPRYSDSSAAPLPAHETKRLRVSDRIDSLPG